MEEFKVEEEYVNEEEEIINTYSFEEAEISKEVKVKKPIYKEKLKELNMFF